MLLPVVRNVLGRFGLSLHRKDSIDRLHRELDRARRSGGAPAASSEPPAPVGPGDGAAAQHPDYFRVLDALDWYEQRRSQFLTTADTDLRDKQTRLVDGIAEFGRSDFADLACWLFASSLNNHRVLHQRIDEGAQLWRAVKMTAGPILEVGRAAGGSTVAILGASGDRKVVSIDRAPTHADIAARIFSRPDVEKRLTLYTQSSREPIAEDTFGMMFIDGDHSYEGVCHDIACFWNMLKPVDGKMPIAVFHDAAANPITYVEAVKKACDELIAERGAAKVIGSWGSMLALEKHGDIDPDRWHAKENRDFWKRYASPAFPVLSPRVPKGRLDASKPPAPVPAGPAPNLIGEDNVDTAGWTKTGVTIETVYPEADNPVRFLRAEPAASKHEIRKRLERPVPALRLTAFVRPVNAKTVRFTVLDEAGASLADVDFELTDNGRVLPPRTEQGVEVGDAGFLYGNGFFRCDLVVTLPVARPAAGIVIATPKDAALAADSASGCGFMINLASVRSLGPR